MTNERNIGPTCRIAMQREDEVLGLGWEAKAAGSLQRLQDWYILAPYL